MNRKIHKSHKLANVCYEIRGPVLERAVKARQRFESLLDFGDEPPIKTATD